MYQWRKGIATWVDPEGTLYISVPFTWLVDEATKIAARWHGDYRIGGPAMMEPNACDGFDPLIYHNPCATFTTRGCPNRCGFCAVPQLEPDFVEIPDFRPAPVICDNNLLAASKTHLRKVVDKLKIFPIVDFNQGLDATRFTPETADMFGELRCKVRFAFDGWGQEAAVKDAVDLCQRRTTKDIGIYCLIGYDDTLEDARARLELIRSWGVLPNPMRYQPLDAKKKNDYVAPGWTDKELSVMMRYYSKLNWIGHIPLEDYTRKRGEHANTG